MSVIEKPIQIQSAIKKIALVGNPNVGKSLIFNHLSGAYATVSNYPGTTVGVTQGKLKVQGMQAEVVDTPGMYSLISITEEERVARSILMNGDLDLIIHVVDAKNLERMLPFTLQLIEAGFPLILCLNMVDELEQRQLTINQELLEQELGVPVVLTAAVTGKGVHQLKQAIQQFSFSKENQKDFTTQSLKTEIDLIENGLTADYPMDKKAVATLFLQEDAEVVEWVRRKENSDAVDLIVQKAKKRFRHSLQYEIALNRQREVKKIVRKVFVGQEMVQHGFGQKLSHWMMNPWTGLPILAVVLYFGLYQFVGVFGGGTLVDLIEGKIFEAHINPFFVSVFEKIIPWETVRDLFTGEYGVLTLGVRYAVALVLPIVGSFFLFFAMVEDSGYLPRLAMLVDRVFKKIGLNGRAVIPIVLGFGCDTMATIVTRILETKRERIIATLLLALAIPCSAQLGVILAVLAAYPAALLCWVGLIGLEFLFIGFLAAKAMPGEKPSFYMELPPLRFPKLSNVFLKTMSRMEWYFKEVFPLFILASVLIWIGKVTGIFQLLIKGFEPMVQMLGLPKETAVAFLFGFFRRDYGAAGLFDLNETGVLTGLNLLVACVTLTLFLPCVAQFLVMKKEHGLKITMGISAFVLFLALGTGYLLNKVCLLFGWSF